VNSGVQLHPYAGKIQSIARVGSSSAFRGIGKAVAIRIAGGRQTWNPVDHLPDVALLIAVVVDRERNGGEKKAGEA
jgi:hypothetical protein